MNNDMQDLTLNPTLELPIAPGPADLPAPRAPSRRFRNFFKVGKVAKAKQNVYLKAFLFARELIPLQMKSKVMQKSIKLQHHLSTREARQLVKAARKHLRRSHEQPA
jgi:hypothetical protein